MPSRAVTSFLPQIWQKKLVMLKTSCQCPLGLLPHFYLVSAADTQRPVCQKCQCPLGLLPHFYCSTPVEIGTEIKLCVNALSGCYLISTFRRLKAKTKKWRCVNALSGCYLISTVPLQKPRFYAVSRACFCRYLSEYSDSNSFSCMLTIWTYLMR